MTLHIYRASKINRIRKMCPYHKHLCRGEMHEYYDVAYVFFDCGTQIMGNEWVPPKQYRRLEIFWNGDHWSIYNRRTDTFFGKAKTKSGIKRIAQAHLEKDGVIL